VVVGKILYRKEHWDQLGLASSDDADRTGVIVWVKPAVTAADSADVASTSCRIPTSLTRRPSISGTTRRSSRAIASSPTTA